jgi:hypothetical protein
MTDRLLSRCYHSTDYVPLTRGNGTNTCHQVKCAYDHDR